MAMELKGLKVSKKKEQGPLTPQDIEALEKALGAKAYIYEDDPQNAFFLWTINYYSAQA
jgi:hypothetical protein